MFPPLSRTVPPWHGPIGWPPGFNSKKLGVMEYLNSAAKAVVETRATAASKAWEMRHMEVINRLCFPGTMSALTPALTNCNGKHKIVVNPRHSSLREPGLEYDTVAN